jgi:hypothetical protein
MALQRGGAGKSMRTVPKALLVVDTETIKQVYGDCCLLRAEAAARQNWKKIRRLPAVFWLIVF